MLQVEKPQLNPVAGGELPASGTLRDQIGLVLSFLRRQYIIVLVCVVLSALLGALYLYLMPTSFTASAVMMIDTRRDQLLPSSLSEGPADAAWIESQIGILKSGSVASYVVKQLHLADDPEFAQSNPGQVRHLVAAAFRRLGWSTEWLSSESKSEPERVRQAAGAVASGLQVRRVGPSYMIGIDFHAQNPELAVKVANAMVDAYAFDQLNAKYQANRRAGDWLQDRLQTLREQAASAERAVLEFKAKNNIVSAGGRLMNDEQLDELAKQLGAARAHTADVQARLNRIEAVLRADQPDATGNETVSDAMTNAIIAKLRGQYLELVNREADWSTKYGRNHSAVVNLRNQMRDIKRSMQDELGRIAETYKSEYEIAKRRQDELEKQLGALVSQSQDTNQAQVALHSLESAAQSYRKLYDDFLQRHTESVQQQSFPMTEARLISPAGISRTDPQKPFVWMLAVVGGAVLGIGFGALRELMDHVFRTGGQLQSVLEIECLALVPLLRTSSAPRLLPNKRSASSMDRPPPRYVEAIPSINVTVDLGSGAKSTISVGDRGAPARLISSDAKILRTVIDAPSSMYADAMRSIKLTLDLNNGTRSTRVIGVTSCLEGEGKSTVAAGIAQLMAQGGARVILVDCDLRNPALSRKLAPAAKVGFHDVIARKCAVETAVWNDPSTNMAFLPAIAHSTSPNSTEVLASDAAKWLFEALQVRYDYVIVDLPPLAPVVDVRATTRLIESYILVVEWGRTKVDVVQRCLSNARGVQDNTIGAVLNKVDMEAMKRYDSYHSQCYYNRQYAS